MVCKLGVGILTPQISKVFPSILHNKIEKTVPAPAPVPVAAAVASFSRLLLT